MGPRAIFVSGAVTRPPGRAQMRKGCGRQWDGLLGVMGAPGLVWILVA